jgi:hypothetical protein
MQVIAQRGAWAKAAAWRGGAGGVAAKVAARGAQLRLCGTCGSKPATAPIAQQHTQVCNRG